MNFFTGTGNDLKPVYKVSLFAIPAPVFIGINSSKNPEAIENSGFLFSRK